MGNIGLEHNPPVS